MLLQDLKTRIHLWLLTDRIDLKCSELCVEFLPANLESLFEVADDTSTRILSNAFVACELNFKILLKKAPFSSNVEDLEIWDGVLCVPNHVLQVDCATGVKFRNLKDDPEKWDAPELNLKCHEHKRV